MDVVGQLMQGAMAIDLARRYTDAARRYTDAGATQLRIEPDALDTADIRSYPQALLVKDR